MKTINCNKNSEIIKTYLSLREMIEKHLFDNKPIPSDIEITALSYSINNSMFNYEVTIKYSKDIFVVKGSISSISPIYLTHTQTFTPNL